MSAFRGVIVVVTGIGTAATAMVDVVAADDVAYVVVATGVVDV